MRKQQVVAEYIAPDREDVTVVIHSLTMDLPIALTSGDKLIVVVDRAEKPTNTR